MLTKILAQAENYDCWRGDWSGRLVIKDTAAAASEFCTQMGRLSMELKL
jgi:hypothetical protein